MDKYVAVAHSFCDACVNGRTCKGTCRRITVMEELAKKYNLKSRAFDAACDSLVKHDVYPGLSKEEIKQHYLKNQ